MKANLVTAFLAGLCDNRYCSECGKEKEQHEHPRMFNGRTGKRETTWGCVNTTCSASLLKEKNNGTTS